MPLAGLDGEGVEGFRRGEDVRLQQPPETVIWIVLAHVGRGREQQQVLRAPGQLPTRAKSLDARQCLGQLVAIGLADTEVRLAVGRQLVALVEDNQIVGDYLGLLEPGEHPAATQRVHAHDDQIAVRADERVAGLGLAAFDHPERQAEQDVHFPFPVPDQTGRRDDEDAPDQPPCQHLPVVEAGHNRLASARIVEQPVAEPRLGQHVVVDGNPLVRQRVDLRNLGGEGRVVEVPVGQPFAFDDDADDLRVGREVQSRRSGSRLAGESRWLRLLLRAEDFGLVELLELAPRRSRGAGLGVLPAVDRGERDPEARRELGLRQGELPAQTFHPIGEIVGHSASHTKAAHAPTPLFRPPSKRRDVCVLAIGITSATALVN